MNKNIKNEDGLRIITDKGLPCVALPFKQNMMCLVVGDTGSGKTVLINKIAYEYYIAGYKIIFLTEKKGSEMENCFMAFPPTEKYHLNNLEAQHFKEETGMDYDLPKIEIYHPFTFNLTEHKYPDVFKPFTIDINTISRPTISAFLGIGGDSTVVRVCESILKRKTNHNLYSFIHTVYKEIKNYDGEEIGEDSMGLPIKMEGSKKTIEKISLSFAEQKKHFFLADKDSEINIDYKKIIKDTKTITFFTNKKMDNETYEYGINTHHLEQIAKFQGELRQPMIIFLEELKHLLPKTMGEFESYQKVLAKGVRNTLATIRSTGTTIIGSTQSYYGTNSEIVDGMPEKIFMKTSDKDTPRLKKEWMLNKESGNMLSELGTGELSLFKEIKEDFRQRKFTVQCPPFANHETKYKSFFEYWKKIYKDKTYSLKELINKMKEKKKQQGTEAKLISKQKEKPPKQEIKKQDNTKVRIYKQQIKENKIKNYYDMIKNTDINSFNKIAKKYGISPITLRKNAILYCLEIQDLKLMEIIATKKFVTQHMPENYDLIFNPPPALIKPRKEQEEEVILKNSGK